MEILNNKKRLLLKAGINLILLVLICFPVDIKAQGNLEDQRSQNVQSYIDNYTKVFGTAQPVLERLRSEHQDFYGEFGDALTAMDVYIKISNGEDWKAVNVLVNSLSSKLFDELVKKGYISTSIKGTLSFFTTAKAAMELFRDFVFDPYLMSEAVETYYMNRERHMLEPADAIATVRAEGTIREQLLKEFEKKHGTEPFVLNNLNLIDASGHELKNNYWRQEFQKFRVEFFEQAYIQRKFLELKEEIEKKKNELEGEMPSLESRMDAILEEILNSVEEISINPKNSTLEIGESVEFTVTATNYRRDETDITDEAMIVNVTDESRLKNKNTFVAESPGAHSISAIYDGLAADGSIKRFMVYATVVVNESSNEMPKLLLITPMETTIGVGETATFTATAVFEDEESTTNVTSLEATTWSTGSNSFTANEAGETTVTVTYMGLSAEATVTVEGEQEIQCSQPSEIFDEESGTCVCNTEEGYEQNEDLGKCINIDEAIDEIVDDSDEAFCNEEVLTEKLARLEEMAASGNRLAADFHTMFSKFMKEINDQESNPCTNHSIAYTYASVKSTMGKYRAIENEVTGLGTDLMLEGALCPLEELEIDVTNVLQKVSQIGQLIGEIERGIADMENQLLTYGCDQQEVSDLGDTIADRTTNPEVIESGAVGVQGNVPGVPGGGFDTGTFGVVIAQYHGFDSPRSSINISVRLNTTNATFTLNAGGQDFKVLENISLKEGDSVQINVPGTGLNASINLRESDFVWIDPNTSAVAEPGNGNRMFSLTIVVFFDSDEMRYRMTVILGQGGFGYPGTPGGGRVLEF